MSILDPVRLSFDTPPSGVPVTKKAARIESHESLASRLYYITGNPRIREQSDAALEIIADEYGLRRLTADELDAYYPQITIRVKV